MEQKFTWPDQIQGAVTLSYDDGLPVHYTFVEPLLRRHDLHASFFPMTLSDLCQQPDEWKRLAEAGHELGNHSIFHPCRQGVPEPYPWLDDRYDLSRYTLEHMRAELEVANLVLHLLDGRRTRSYASTCGDMSVGRGDEEESIEPLLQELFFAVRGVMTNRIVQPDHELNFFNVGCIMGDRRPLEGLKQIVEQARESGGWAALVFHGVGAGTHELYSDTEVHKQFIEWLARQQEIWTAPFRTIVQYIKDNLPTST
jgi:sialate O-acetylesterase